MAEIRKKNQFNRHMHIAQAEAIIFSDQVMHWKKFILMKVLKKKGLMRLNMIPTGITAV